jgi:hypothetical protein
MSTEVRAYTGESIMCPNCLTGIVMALGGAGSAVPPLLLGASLVAAAGLRYRIARAPGLTQSNTEETES